MRPGPRKKEPRAVLRDSGVASNLSRRAVLDGQFLLGGRGMSGERARPELVPDEPGCRFEVAGQHKDYLMAVLWRTNRLTQRQLSVGVAERLRRRQRRQFVRLPGSPMSIRDDHTPLGVLSLSSTVRWHEL